MTYLSGSGAAGGVGAGCYKERRIDPAVDSGQLITTLNDVFALAFYFEIAQMLLQAWG